MGGGFRPLKSECLGTMKRTFGLVDTAFATSRSIIAGKTPQLWQWVRGRSARYIPTFYSNESVFEAKDGNENYAIIIEPRSLLEFVYINLPFVIRKFRYVFTYDSQLLSYFPDVCKRIPGGGVWIGGEYGLGDVKVYPKNKVVSIVSSTKSICQLHLFRYQLALALQNFEGVDVFIAEPGKYINIVDTLSDYMYSIIVENYIDDFFFTEKILNCFATGTVPIYCGARRIGDFFDLNGIIMFESWAELLKILPTLSKQDYEQRKEAITKNFLLSFDYDNMEDYMVKTYGNILPFHTL